MKRGRQTKNTKNRQTFINMDAESASIFLYAASYLLYGHTCGMKIWVCGRHVCAKPDHIPSIYVTSEAVKLSPCAVCPHLRRLSSPLQWILRPRPTCNLIRVCVWVHKLTYVTLYQYFYPRRTIFDKQLKILLVQLFLSYITVLYSSVRNELLVRWRWNFCQILTLCLWIVSANCYSQK